MKEYLHLFTDVKEALPKNNQKVAFISTSKDGALYEGLGTFFEKDQWQRQNVFIGDGYHFIDNKQFPERNWKVTHWLDLSKLTTKERAVEAIIDQVSAEVGGLSEQEITGIKLIARPKL